MDPIEQIKQSIARNKVRREEEAQALDEKYQVANSVFEPVIAILDAARILGVEVQNPESRWLDNEPTMSLSWSLDYSHTHDCMTLHLPFSDLSYAMYFYEYRSVSATLMRRDGRIEDLRSTDAIIDAVVSCLMDTSDLESRLTAVTEQANTALTPEIENALSGLAPVISRISR